MQDPSPTERTERTERSELLLPTIELRRAAALRRFGDATRQLERAAARGELSRVRRGHYVDAAEWQYLSYEQRHLMKVVAAAPAARTPPVFSHESAAVALGLSVVEPLPSRVQITVPPGSGLRSNRRVARHEAALDADEVIDLGPLLVTSVRRTLVDFAATRSFLSGACAVEHALHRGDVDHDELCDAIATRKPFRGSRRADAVAAFASPLSASPNETLCRVRFAELGVPQPQQQVRFRGLNGIEYPVDFYWPQFDAIGETDGRVKYEQPEYLAGRTPQEALWDEKQREDELRAQCRRFVRLTWNDAWNRAPLAVKLARAGIRHH
ncbi:MAG TPA: hypothetical protein VL294_00945 [Pseudolysinimonas sp.]|jgi:hypothetical protein|nr:hypothetical protein [Pseudolysinimonas sp.]